VVIAFMTEKRKKVYDSMGYSGRRHLDAIFRYLGDEHMDEKKERKSDLEEGVLVEKTHDTPQQRNGTYDLGCCPFLKIAGRCTNTVTNVS
jgi:Ulp1 family protease